MSSDFSTNVQERSSTRVKKPRMYRVVLHNDDYTPMEFVVEVLMRIFHQNSEQATKIMLEVHERGRGQVGVYTYDVAQTKVRQTSELARKMEFPLKTSVEEA
ncbi:ATP-dependent Clp protease adapter ClpS [Spirochaeta dissipatitropha]